MIKNRFLGAGFVVLAGIFLFVRVNADDVLSQPDFSSSQSEGWGSFTSAIGIASGTISEFGTTTAALGDFMQAYLGWECEARIENNGAPFWCGQYIPLTVATTTLLGTSTRAFVFQNPHQAVDGDVQLFYIDFYGGNPAYMGFGAAANTTPNLSWTWTCGPYCRSGGSLGGTSNYFVPYFEMGPQADPPTISSLGQSNPGGVVPEGGTVFGSSVSFSATLRSGANDPLILQVEVEPIGAPFTGAPTASSTAIVSGGTASVVVANLADGGYRWAARAVDANTSESSAWIYFTQGGTVPDFIVQKPKEPIVFIPGIVGSRLTRAADGKEIWPDVDDMLLSPSDDYLDDLALASDGSQISGKEMVVSSIIDKESVLGISASYYAPILQALVADGYSSGANLFEFPYDWRLGVKSAAAALANTVTAARAASSDGKVSIVAHSMGGLVVKEYLAGLSDTSFVDKVVLLGDPQLGAPLAFKDLNYGDNLGFQIPILNLDVLNHDEVKKIAQNMPGVYDLLPSRAYVADDGGYVQDFRNGASTVLDFDATNRFMLANPSDSRNDNLINSADVLHGAIDGAAVNAPDVYNIMGCAEPTISGYRLYDNGVVDVTRSDGDGIVPLVSAMDRADAFKNYFISGAKTGITHTDLVSDARVASLVTAILDDQSPSFSLPDGFSGSLNSCFPSASLGASGEDFIEFSAHGAAGITVRNDNSLSTGLNASGTVDLGIPDSTYESIGDNYFITVPAGGDYNVTTNSTSSDVLVVKATGYDGGVAAQTATYIVSSTVPEGQGSDAGAPTVELGFSGFSSPANAEVTRSGNESSSTESGPENSTSTFFIAPIIASSSGDIAPPEITISDIPLFVTQGSATTISFSAMDTDSGVALLSASLNGVPIASGDTVTFAQVGNNVLRIEAIDNAGNPVVKEIDITVSAPLVPSPAERPHEVTFAPIDDTYIDGNNPDADYGGSSILRLRARGKDRVLIKFDTIAIENEVGSSTISSATLTFSVAKNWENWTGNSTVELHRMTVPWTENVATWNAENDTSSLSWIIGPSATATVSDNTTGNVSFDVTADVETFLRGAESDGWILKKADECASGVIDFGSRESATPPVLTVTYE